MPTFKPPLPAGGDFDAMGAAYATSAESSPYNALYDRPAVLDLAGDVGGRRVLDAGCAAGALSAALAARGATVVGVDASREMIRLARERRLDAASFAVADLARPMPFLADESFDLVTASLVLHYLRDWDVPLAEFRRVLRPSGRLVMTTHHPAAAFAASPNGDYRAVELITEEWVKDGRPYDVRWFRRPLSAMVGPILSAGFVIERIVEPLPQPEMHESHPDVCMKLMREPWFLAISAVRP
jgi:SAM-dependent methyltransferase